MRILYSTNFGKFTNGDFFATEIAAEVPTGEHLDALNQGFLFFNGKWRLVRSVRVNLEKTDYSQYYGGIQLFKYNSDLDSINDMYLAYKGYNKTDSDTNVSDNDMLWGYYTDRLVAWSKVYKYNGAMESKYFAWDYANPKLRMGIVSLQHEIAYAKSLGHQHYYLGPGYESSSKYKCEFDGFEWFTGNEWSTDKELYKEYCDNDSRILMSFSK